MSIEKMPPWTKEQIREGMNIQPRTTTEVAIDTLSVDTLIGFFEKHKDSKFSKTNAPRNSAAHIVAYQKALKHLGYTLETDGLFGNHTKNALQRFQTDKKLISQNGFPGPETAGALIKALEGKLPPPPKKPEATKEVRKTPLKEAKAYLISQKFTENQDGSYSSADGKFQIIIENNIAKRRSFLNFFVPESEQLIIAETNRRLTGNK